MRSYLSPLSLILVTGCSLIVGPGSKFLDGSTGAPDAGPDAQLPDGRVDTPDGGDAGPPVEPLPPVGSGVGLSDYTPRPGDTLEAYVGPFFDPNGDPVSIEVEWLLNDAPIPGASGATLVVPEAATGADVYSVAVTLTDGALTTTLRAGPARVHDDTDLRWEQLLPLRGAAVRETVGIFDATHQRMIFYGAAEGVGLWEAQLTGGSDVRWVHLESVSGVGPTGELTVIADPSRDRLLFLTGTGLSALEMEGSQGSERWASVPSRGDERSGSAVPAHLRFRMPDGEEVVFLYGGLGRSEAPVDEAYLLHLEDSDRWERLRIPLPPVVSVLPQVFFHEETKRVFLAGGATPAVYAWDLDDAREAGFVLVEGLVLPHAILGGGATIDGDIVTLYGGATDVGMSSATPNNDVFTLNLSTLDVASAPAVSPPQPGIAFPVSAAPFGTGDVVFMHDFDFRGLSFYRFDPNDGSFDAISADGVDLPPPLMQGQAIVDERGFILSHGRTSFEEATGTRATFAYRDARFSTLGITGDAPEPRWGAVADNSDLPRPAISWFLGGHPPPGPLSSSIWRLQPDRMWWEETTVAIGGSVPPSREGHVLMHGTCRDSATENRLGMYGGRLTSTGAITDELWMSRCPVDGTTDCTWVLRDTASGSLLRGGRVWSAVSHLHPPGGRGDPRTAVITGGLAPGGLRRTEAFVVDTCDRPSALHEWVSAAISGTTPPARLGHSTSAVIAADGSQELAYWMFGGIDEEGGGTFGDLYEMRWNGDRSNPTVTFTAVTAAGPAPRARMFHQVAYDRAQNRLLVYGGLDHGRVLDDLWELRLPE